MNTDNLNLTIDLMRTTDKNAFSLDQYFHPCGTPSCLAGVVAEAGHIRKINAEETSEYWVDLQELTEFWDIPALLTSDLTCVFGSIYKKHNSDLELGRKAEPKHVIKVLEMVRDGEII